MSRVRAQGFWRLACQAGRVNAQMLQDSMEQAACGQAQTHLAQAWQCSSGIARSFVSAPALCWACQHATPSSHTFFCPSCGRIQPRPQEPDYFEVMSLQPNTFNVDPKQLEQRFKALQRELHPDRFGQRSREEQQHSADQSALVNQAYSTLQAPLRRATYLLQRQGVTAVDTEGTVEDPEQLMAIMELQEEIDETEEPAELQRLQEGNASRTRAVLQDLSEAFSRGDTDKALQLVFTLRYLKRIGDAIAAKT